MILTAASSCSIVLDLKMWRSIPDHGQRAEAQRGYRQVSELHLDHTRDLQRCTCANAAAYANRSDLDADTASVQSDFEASDDDDDDSSSGSSDRD